MKDDTISRAAAVDALDRLEYTPGEWAASGLTMCKDAIKALPPALPWDANTRNSMAFTLRTVANHGDMDAIDEDNIKRLSRWLEGERQ